MVTLVERVVRFHLRAGRVTPTGFGTRGSRIRSRDIRHARRPAAVVWSSGQRRDSFAGRARGAGALLISTTSAVVPRCDLRPVTAANRTTGTGIYGRCPCTAGARVRSVRRRAPNERAAVSFNWTRAVLSPSSTLSSREAESCDLLNAKADTVWESGAPASLAPAMWLRAHRPVKSNWLSPPTETSCHSNTATLTSCDLFHSGMVRDNG